MKNTLFEEDARVTGEAARPLGEEVVERIVASRPLRLRVGSPHGAAEGIAARDLNNLYRTSMFFRDVERYKAFCAYYAIMRVVDDRIDEGPVHRDPSPARRLREDEVVSAWREAVAACASGRFPEGAPVRSCRHPQAADLLEAAFRSFAVFPTPLVLWENFFGAMHADLDRKTFDTWSDFLAYTEGASVAPTTIYLFLLASRRGHGKAASPVPGFDLLACGRDLGIFAYIGHIVRDLAEDLRAGGEGRNTLTKEDMASHGVTEAALRADLDRESAAPPLRALISTLVGRARRHLDRGRARIDPVRKAIDPDCRFILRLIVTIYERVLDKIESCSFDPFTGRHRLTRAEKWAIVSHVMTSENGSRSG